MSALDSELAALPTLSAHQLRLKWQDLRCGEPTAAASRDLMIREIAYKMQERAHGGLAPGFFSGGIPSFFRRVVSRGPKGSQ